MDDLISRQAAIDTIDEIESEVADGDGFQYEKWKQYFCDLPSADIDLSDYSDRLWRNAYERGKADAESERKRGKWEVRNVLDYAQRPTGRKYGICSTCGYLTDDFRTMIEANKELTNFCPNCGADMRGGGE